MNKNLIWIGTIVNTHGIKGEVKVLSDSDFISKRFKKNSKIFLENGNELTIEGFRKSGNFFLIKIEGFDSINESIELKTKKIFGTRSIKSSNEYFLKDLIEFEVFDLYENKNLGKIKSIYKQNFFYSYEVLKKDEKDKHFNIPLNGDFIKKIDFENNKVFIIGEELI